MKKIKILIATMLSAIVLVFTAVFGGNVNAETSTLIGTRSIDAVTSPNITSANTAILSLLEVQSDSANNYGWKSVDGGSSNQNNVSYRKYTSAEHNLRSPLLCANDKTVSANKVVVDVNVAFSSKNASSFIIKALNSSGTVLETRTVNIAAQSSSKTYVDAEQQVFTVESGSIAYISLFHNGVDTYFGGVDISYYLVQDDSGIDYYTATYNLGSASGQIASSKVVQGSENKTIKLPDPSLNDVTYANHTFAGWKLGDDIYSAGDEYILDSDVEFIAQWTENAKYNVTYYIDGIQLTDVDSKYTSVYTGASLEYYPTYDNKAFDGWYTSTDYSTKISSVTSNISAYGRKVDLKYVLDQSDLKAETLSSNIVHYSGTMFTLTSGLKISTDTKILPNGVSSTYRINTSGSSFNSTSNIRSIDFVAPSDGKVVLYANTNSASKQISLYSSHSQDDVIQSFTTEAANTVYFISFDVNKDQSYSLGMNTNGSFYFVEFVPSTVVSYNAKITVTAEKNSDASQLRFITKLEGVELSKVASIELVLYKGSVAEANRNKGNLYMTSVYTSITNSTESCETATNTYYGIVKLTNAQSLKVATSTLYFNAIVTYTDGSQATMDYIKTFATSTL